MGPEYLAGQINSYILELLLRRFCFLFFHRLENVNMLNRFPKDHKRYYSHLQVLILHQVVPIKVYLKFMRASKTAI